MAKDLVALGDWVILSLPEEEEQKETVTTTGLILVGDDPNESKMPTGKVVSVGPGTYNLNGGLNPVPIEVGATVLYAQNQGYPQEVDGKKFYILKPVAIMAIVKE